MADGEAAFAIRHPPSAIQSVILPPSMSDEPEYLICLQCDTPTYQFEYVKGKLAQVVCTTCGADDPADFVTEAELEEQS
jgi:hypothetical protein